MTNEWLGLNAAARQLGIHPTTLRRWADAGEVPVMVTPGRHRRFALVDLERFTAERLRLRTIGNLERIWAEQAMAKTRTEIVRQRETPWLAVFDEQNREHKRVLGRRLMGLMLQYVSLQDGGEDLLDEARSIGREHAANALSLGLPLASALQIVLFFRDTLFDVALQLPDVANVRPEANVRLLRRMTPLLNAVELAVAETYDQATNK
ncbi:MAG: helix-turn-helix domain-containing protein [Chloroflexi bacterium]|nr:helix-turn-helix domain-containing protein [Chloroflexota bacterium]